MRKKRVGTNGFVINQFYVKDEGRNPGHSLSTDGRSIFSYNLEIGRWVQPNVFVIPSNILNSITTSTHLSRLLSTFSTPYSFCKQNFDTEQGLYGYKRKIRNQKLGLPYYIYIIEVPYLYNNYSTYNRTSSMGDNTDRFLTPAFTGFNWPHTIIFMFSKIMRVLHSETFNNGEFKDYIEYAPNILYYNHHDAVGYLADMFSILNNNPSWLLKTYRRKFYMNGATVIYKTDNIFRLFVRTFDVETYCKNNDITYDEIPHSEVRIYDFERLRDAKAFGAIISVFIPYCRDIYEHTHFFGSHRTVVSEKIFEFLDFLWLHFFKDKDYVNLLFSDTNDAYIFFTNQAGDLSFINREVVKKFHETVKAIEEFGIEREDAYNKSGGELLVFGDNDV